MTRRLDGFRQAGSGLDVLIAVASEVEWRAIAAGFAGPGEASAAVPALWTLARLNDRTSGVLTGVSKSNAAGGLARVLDRNQHSLVVSLGIAGALPGIGGAGPVPIGSVVAGSASLFADEGMESRDGWTTMAELGFPVLGGEDAIEADPIALAAVSDLADVQGTIATVSICSGSDARAAQIARRTMAIAEAMEGAAAGLVSQRLGVRFLELRVISNLTGDRDRQRWSISEALLGLTKLAREL